MPEEALVLGLGNELLGDEGVGVHAVRRLEASGCPARCLDGGTLGLSLYGDVAEAARLVVVDATRLDAAPGTVRVFEGGDLDGFLGSGPRDVHGVGLAQLLSALRLSGALPERRALVAVQPATTDWGTELSPEVAGALPAIQTHARTLLERWGR